MNLQEALARIEYLEKENAYLKKELNRYKRYKPQGRKVHDEKWMESYKVWEELYDKGFTVMDIVSQTGISRRTCYRYKAYYEERKKEVQE